MTSDNKETLEERYILDFGRSLMVRNRRNALLANWIAIRTGRHDTAALTEEVTRLAEVETTDVAFCDRVLSELKPWGISLDPAEFHTQAHALLLDAAEQLEAESNIKPAD